MAQLSTVAIPVAKLHRKAAEQLSKEARRLGVAPDVYAGTLIESALSLRRWAEQTELSEILEPVRRRSRPAGDLEIVKLVHEARRVPPGRAGRGRKKR